MDNLKERFDHFGKDPSPEIWDKIEGAMDTDEEKLIGWWLYAAAGITLILGLGYYALQYSKDIRPDNIAEKVIPTLNDSKAQESTENNNDIRDGLIKLESNIVENGYKLDSIDQLNDEILVKQNDLINTAESNHGTNQAVEVNIVLNNDGRDRNESSTSNIENTTNVDGNISVNAKKEHLENDVFLQNELVIEPVNDNQFNEIVDGNLSHTDDDVFERKPNDEILFMYISAIKEIDNTRNISPINRDLYLPEINFNKWSFLAQIKKGFIDNKTIGLNRIASVNESFTLTNLDYQIESNYINDKPIWFDVQTQKKISRQVFLILSIEYGEQKSSITVNRNTVYTNTNKNIGGGMGVGCKLMKYNRLSIALNGVLRVGNEINDWKKIEISANPMPITSITDMPSADIIDQVITNPKSKSNIMTNGEFGLPVIYQLSEKIGIQLTPFIRQFLSQKYPGSDNFGEPFQWGVGGGITF